jgi:hypothetical protein
MNREVKKLVCKYSSVYKLLKKLQPKNKEDNSSILSTGDQITGVIAEYYAKFYIEVKFKPISIEYSKTNKPYDIIYDKKKVQVKAVSDYSKSRVIAPLRLSGMEDSPTFDFLYLLDLDKNFEPIGFYINTFEEIIKKNPTYLLKKKRIVGSVMKSHSDDCEKHTNGSFCFNFKNNIVNEMRTALGLGKIRI